MANKSLRSSSASSSPLTQQCLLNTTSPIIPFNMVSEHLHTTTSFNFITNYLMNACGMSSENAIRASVSLSHLKSTENPDSVFRFLRRIGLSFSTIGFIVSADPKLLCANVEKILRPNLSLLKKKGFSQSDLTQLLVLAPSSVRQVDLPDRVKVLLPVFGTVDKFLKAVKRNTYILKYSLGRVISPNLYLLERDCNLSGNKLVQVLMSCSRLITSNPDDVKLIAQRAEKLGLCRQSGLFYRALMVTSGLKQTKIDEKMKFFERIGFSKTEIGCMIRKDPKILAQSEEKIATNLAFLLKEVECERSYVAQRPALLMYSVEWRLNPRNAVRKILKEKGTRAGNMDFYSFVVSSEKLFLEKFVIPFEDEFPEISEVYAA